MTMRKLKKLYIDRLVLVSLWDYKSVVKQFRRVSKKDLTYHGNVKTIQFRNRFVLIIVGKYIKSCQRGDNLILTLKSFCHRERITFNIVVNAPNIVRVRRLTRYLKKSAK